MTGQGGNGQLPGSAEPRKRLPITPESLVGSARRRAERVRRPSVFPWSAPTWPGTVARPPVERELGVHYDTDWARRWPARFARVLLVELVSRPAIAAIAAPEVHGLDRIDHLDEPVIFAANHMSHVDTPLVLSHLPERWRHRTVVAGAADYFFDTKPKAAAFALTWNVIPIERRRVSRDSANRAAALLREGWSLLIFPEGGRSPDGWGQSHQPGAAWLGVRTGRPVVPVHLGGTGRILPRGSNRLRPGRSTMTFGRPLRPQAGENPRTLAETLERAIDALADERATDWWSATRRAAAGRTPHLTGPQAGAWRRSWTLGAARARGRRQAGPGHDGSHRWPKD